MTEAKALEAAATRANGLAPFFAREKRRAARRIALPWALLSEHGLRYLVGRGSLLFARVPLRVGFHLAEVIVLADFLELGLFGRLLAVRSATVAFGALHWGALEPLRKSVRTEAARGNPGGAQLEIARYLRLGLDLSVLQLGLLVAWLKFGPRPFSGFSILDAYAIGCGLRAMAETWTRTFHAGAFALRRVRRPWAALFAVDAADVGSTLLLWPWLGAWSFALSQLVGGALEAVLTVHYTRAAYRSLTVRPPPLSLVLSDRARVSFAHVRAMVAPALGNLVSQVDVLLITSLALASSRVGLGLAAGLHVLRPMLSLGSGWARLFYFNLARLEGPVRFLFRARLERQLVRAAPLFALATAALAALLTLALVPSAPLAEVLWFLPFLIARSLYAAFQIRAFARASYGALALGALVVGAAVVLLPHLPGGGAALLGLATGALSLGALAFRLGGSRAVGDAADDEEKLLRPLPFLAALARSASPSRVVVASVHPRGGTRTLAVARALAALPGVALAARFARRGVVLALAPDTGLGELVTASGGSLHEVALLPPEPNGERAVRALLESGRLGFLPADAEGVGEPALRRDFAQHFPRGVVLDETRGALPRGRATPLELARTLNELATLASGSRLTRRRGLRAAVFAPGGEARVVFVAAASDDPAQFAEFERRVQSASAVATLPLA